MKIGLCMPYMERDYDRKAILEWCRRIDQGPFSSISCGERITGYTFEMRILLAAAAAVTERVRIVPSLYVLPMHSAVWAAKEIATLDQLSDGRVDVVVGVGGREQDYRAVGANFSKRHQRMDEQVAEMRRIWAGDEPFPGCGEVGPRPMQKGGPALFAGAMGPKPISRASHWARGLYGFAMNGEASLTQYFKDTAEAAWRDSGRAEKPYFIGGFWYSLADDSKSRLKDYVFNYLKVFGDSQAEATAASMTRHNEANIVDALTGLRDLGVDELFLVPATADIAEVERIESVLVRNGFA
jgi:alkanesulfonate monooxygenase SsuD/methylene tetrahydromethanopterin reductase-like flavin-dependent oxidoreductase (luciferase family)